MEAGGSITGEHGVGVDKKRYMPKMFDEPDLAAFQKLRCAFDPHGLANPGKVMPTPRLCGEVPGPYRSTRSSATAWRSGFEPDADLPAELASRLAAGGPVRIAGGGTRAGWGAPVEGAEPLSTAGLDQIVEHSEGDFTAILEAGVPVAKAQERFAAAGQMLALDPPEAPGATIGGARRDGRLRPAAPPLRRRRATS